MSDHPSAGDLEPDPIRHCDFCDTTYGLSAPPPLSNYCEHGLTLAPGVKPRAFADRLRFSTLPDGRVLVQMDMPEDALDGMHVCCLLTARDAEAMRVTLGKPGAAAMAERWRP